MRQSKLVWAALMFTLSLVAATIPSVSAGFLQATLEADTEVVYGYGTVYLTAKAYYRYGGERYNKYRAQIRFTLYEVDWLFKTELDRWTSEGYEYSSILDSYAPCHVFRRTPLEDRDRWDSTIEYQVHVEAIETYTGVRLAHEWTNIVKVTIKR